MSHGWLLPKVLLLTVTMANEGQAAAVALQPGPAPSLKLKLRKRNQDNAPDSSIDENNSTSGPGVSMSGHKYHSIAVLLCKIRFQTSFTTIASIMIELSLISHRGYDNFVSYKNRHQKFFDPVKCHWKGTICILDDLSLLTI